MKAKIVKNILSVHFWIGVNIIGLPLIHTHNLIIPTIFKSKFHK